MGEPAHLLHVFATFGRGGPQMRTVQLMAAMGGSCRHTIVAMDGDTSCRQQIPAEVAVELVDPPEARGFRAMGRAMGELISARAPDLLLTYNWGAIESLLGARHCGLRAVVHHEEGFGPAEATRRLCRRNWIRRLLLRRAAAVVVPSMGLSRIAEREWGQPAGRVRHLANGVDLQRFQPPPSPRSGEPFRIGTVGGLRAEKDQALLLSALVGVSDDLVLVGDGPLRAELEDLAGSLGVADRVEFAGAVGDPAAVYRDLDLFVLTSRTEQMPIALLEAMASGLPAVVTDVGDVRAMLPTECQGGIVPAGDAAALRDAISRYRADPGRRAREGDANRRRCEERYGLRSCLQRFLELYGEVAPVLAKALAGSSRT